MCATHDKNKNHHCTRKITKTNLEEIVISKQLLFPNTTQHTAFQISKQSQSKRW